MTDKIDEVQQISECLRSLPENTVIEWTQHHLDYLGVLTGYVDVLDSEVAKRLGFNWTWEIESPSMREEDQPVEPPSETTIVHPGNWRVWMSWEPGNYESAEPLFCVRILDNGEDEPLTDAQKAVLENLDKNREVYSVSGWKPDEISEMVRQWIIEHSGRSDLTVVHNPELHDPFLDVLYERLQSADDGNTVQIGDGVLAHPDVMDALLSMKPEDAAEITGTMQRVRNESVQSCDDGCNGFSCPYCGRCTVKCPNFRCVREQ